MLRHFNRKSKISDEEASAVEDLKKIPKLAEELRKAKSLSDYKYFEEYQNNRTAEADDWIKQTEENLQKVQSDISDKKVANEDLARKSIEGLKKRIASLKEIRPIREQQGAISIDLAELQSLSQFAEEDLKVKKQYKLSTPAEIRILEFQLRKAKDVLAKGKYQLSIQERLEKNLTDSLRRSGDFYFRNNHLDVAREDALKGQGGPDRDKFKDLAERVDLAMAEPGKIKDVIAQQERALSSISDARKKSQIVLERKAQIDESILNKLKTQYQALHDLEVKAAGLMREEHSAQLNLDALDNENTVRAYRKDRSSQAEKDLKKAMDQIRKDSKSRENKFDEIQTQKDKIKKQIDQLGDPKISLNIALRDTKEETDAAVFKAKLDTEQKPDPTDLTDQMKRDQYKNLKEKNEELAQKNTMINPKLQQVDNEILDHYDKRAREIYSVTTEGKTLERENVQDMELVEFINNSFPRYTAARQTEENREVEKYVKEIRQRVETRDKKLAQLKKKSIALKNRENDHSLGKVYLENNDRNSSETFGQSFQDFHSEQMTLLEAEDEKKRERLNELLQKASAKYERNEVFSKQKGIAIDDQIYKLNAQVLKKQQSALKELIDNLSSQKEVQKEGLQAQVNVTYLGEVLRGMSDQQLKSKRGQSIRKIVDENKAQMRVSEDRLKKLQGLEVQLNEKTERGSLDTVYNRRDSSLNTLLNGVHFEETLNRHKNDLKNEAFYSDSLNRKKAIEKELIAAGSMEDQKRAVLLKKLRGAYEAILKEVEENQEQRIKKEYWENVKDHLAASGSSGTEVVDHRIEELQNSLNPGRIVQMQKQVHQLEDKLQRLGTIGE